MLRDHQLVLRVRLVLWVLQGLLGQEDHFHPWDLVLHADHLFLVFLPRLDHRLDPALPPDPLALFKISGFRMKYIKHKNTFMN